MAAPADPHTRVRPEFATPAVSPPHVQFGSWLQEVTQAGELEPTAMALASLGADGSPRLRFVLCKGFDARGVQFFTNFDSEKGRNLLADPRVAATFHWPTLERQVRLEGRAVPCSDAEADAYYDSRPRLSRIGAHASRQSRPLRDRQELLDRVEAAKARFESEEPPRPAYWSGFWIEAHRWEFWQGKEGRLHDRQVFELDQDSWMTWKLFP